MSGLPDYSVARYLYGQRQPDLAALDKIIKATNGEVGLKDFLDNKPEDKST